MFPSAAVAVVTGTTVSVSTSSVALRPQPVAVAADKANQTTSDRPGVVMEGEHLSRARARSAHPVGPVLSATIAAGFLSSFEETGAARRFPSGRSDTNLRPSARLAEPAEEFR